jgi:hypothetical protein
MVRLNSPAKRLKKIYGHFVGKQQVPAHPLSLAAMSGKEGAVKLLLPFCEHEVVAVSFLNAVTRGSKRAALLLLASVHHRGSNEPMDRKLAAVAAACTGKALVAIGEYGKWLLSSSSTKAQIANELAHVLLAAARFDCPTALQELLPYMDAAAMDLQAPIDCGPAYDLLLPGEVLKAWPWVPDHLRSAGGWRFRWGLYLVYAPPPLANFNSTTHSS